LPELLCTRFRKVRFLESSDLDDDVEVVHGTQGVSGRPLSSPRTS
jgi:hypothetical protein